MCDDFVHARHSNRAFFFLKNSPIDLPRGRVKFSFAQYSGTENLSVLIILHDDNTIPLIADVGTNL